MALVASRRPPIRALGRGGACSACRPGPRAPWGGRGRSASHAALWRAGRDRHRGGASVSALPARRARAAFDAPEQGAPRGARGTLIDAAAKERANAEKYMLSKGWTKRLFFWIDPITKELLWFDDAWDIQYERDKKSARIDNY